MGLKVAVATGNWSNPATWNGGVLPNPGDVVASNNFTVTIDQNINVDLLTNTVQATVSAVPNMTSFTTPSGIVTSSGNYDSARAAWVAFGGNGWLSPNNNPMPQWIAYEFPTVKLITSYSWNAFWNAVSAPRNFQFQGWDGTNWITLHTVTNNTAQNYASPLLTHTTSYIKYQFYITAINGGEFVSMGTIKLFAPGDFNGSSVAGGEFILNDGVTVNANLTGGAVNLITYSGSTSANINGNLLIGTGNYVVNFNSSLGTLNIVGNLQNNGTAGRGILVNNTGTVNLVGDIFTSGSGLYHQQIYVQANGTINITGNIYTVAANCFSGQTMIHLNSMCTFNVVGNIEYLSNNATNARAIAINVANCTVNITGSVYGGRQPNQQAILSGQNHFLSIIGTIYIDNFSLGPSVILTSGSAVNLFSGPFICNEYGFMPYQVVRMHLIPSASSYIEFRDETTGGASAPSVPTAPPTQLISPSAIVGNLPVTDVRFGTTYALGSLTGTLNMPHPNNVSFGTPVDNTFGNLVLTVESIWNHPVEDITVQGSIGMRLKNVATPQTTGEQLEAFLRLD
jgi:hypothetical protein